jgi:hypothetical protein
MLLRRILPKVEEITGFCLPKPLLEIRLLLLPLPLVIRVTTLRGHDQQLVLLHDRLAGLTLDVLPRPADSRAFGTTFGRFSHQRF